MKLTVRSYYDFALSCSYLVAKTTRQTKWYIQQATRTYKPIITPWSKEKLI